MCKRWSVWSFHEVRICETVSSLPSTHELPLWWCCWYPSLLGWSWYRDQGGDHTDGQYLFFDVVRSIFSTVERGLFGNSEEEAFWQSLHFLWTTDQITSDQFNFNNKYCTNRASGIVPTPSGCVRPFLLETLHTPDFFFLLICLWWFFFVSGFVVFSFHQNECFMLN